MTGTIIAAVLATDDPTDYGFRFNRGIPPRALILDLAETDSNRLRKHSRLTLACGDIPAFLIKVLRKRGAEVHCVSNTERALAACQGTTYDVLIFDPFIRDFAAFIRLMKHAEPASAFAIEIEDPADRAKRTAGAQQKEDRADQPHASAAPQGTATERWAVALRAKQEAQSLLEEVLKIREWFEQLGESVVATLRQRYEYVPIFVIPKPSSPEEYSVLIRPPGGAYVEKASKVPLEMAVLRLDARAMFTAMGPLA